jgi:hypothetical protein
VAKETTDTPSFAFKRGLLEKQIDGIFCVEGTLHYSQELKQLIYLYSYRNQYMTMDTDLNLIQRYHTIDTFSHAQIKVAKVESQNYSTLTGIPALINGISCVSGKYLFIRSNLLSKNEDEEKFKAGAVIDVYDLTTGTYSNSFYLADFKAQKLSGFYVFNNQLAAIFGRHLILYDLNGDIFSTPSVYKKTNTNLLHSSKKNLSIEIRKVAEQLKI